LWAGVQSLGPWGVFLTAGLDGAGVPLPGALDAMVATYIYRQPRIAWLYVLLTALGSTLGCSVLYLIGRAGGEMVLARRMPRTRFEKVRRDFEDHPVLALGVPAVLPPPFPLKIFILSAGAFDMRWLHFATVVFLARLVRFGALAGLTLAFGPGIVALFTTAFRRHPAIVLSAIVALIAGALLFRRSKRKPQAQAMAAR